MRLLGLVALAALATRASALQLLKNEPTILYADVSPKLRIITKSSAFSGKFGLAFFLFFRFPIVPMENVYLFYLADHARTRRVPARREKGTSHPFIRGNGTFADIPTNFISFR